MKGAQAGVRHHFSGDMFRISGKPLDAGAAMEDSPLSRTAEGPLERENPRCSVRFVGGEVGPSGAIKAAGELTGAAPRSACGLAARLLGARLAFAPFRGMQG